MEIDSREAGPGGKGQKGSGYVMGRQEAEGDTSKWQTEKVGWVQKY